MSDSDQPSALREWRDHIIQPTTLITLAGVAVLLSLAGAFGTGDLLPLPARLIYWLVIAATTYSVGYLSSELVRRRFGGGMSRPGLVALTAITTGIGVSLTVVVVNWAALSYLPGGAELAEFTAVIFAVAGIVSFVFDMLGRRISAASATESADPPQPPILDRLPVEKRGALVALSVEDHYVRIQTGKGEEVVLMRLADAIREVGATRGLQVHRSHWVATDEVTRARRDGDRAILTVSTGAEIPVSRRNVPAIREAGLLPRTSDG